MPRVLPFGTQHFRRLAVISLLVFAALLGILSYSHISAYRKLVQERSVEILDLAAQKTSATIALWIQEHLNSLEQIAKDPLIVSATLDAVAARSTLAINTEAERGKFQRALSALRRYMASDPSMDFRIYTIDSSYSEFSELLNTEISSAAEQESFPQHLYKYYIEALGGQSLFIPPLTSYIPNEHELSSDFTLIRFLTPVFSFDGEVIAVLERRGHPYDSFSKILQTGQKDGAERDNRYYDSIDTYAYNEVGLMISQPRFRNALTRKLSTSGPTSFEGIEIKSLVEQDVSVRESFVTYPLKIGRLTRSGNNSKPYMDYTEVNVIGSWRWLPNLNMGVISEMDNDSVLRSISQFKNAIFINDFVACLASFIVCALILHYSLRYSNQIEKISEQLEDTIQDRTRELLDNQKKLKRAVKEAKSAAEIKSAFLANMSHEIRTPMNSIIGFGELLQQSKMPETEKKYITTINDSAKSLLNLLNDILDMSKMEHDKYNLVHADFSTVELLDHIISSFALGAHKRQIELRFSIEPDVPHHLYGDPYRLRQIIVNLLSNAIKFTESGWVQLEVYVAEKPDYIGFRVIDTGIGIEQEKLKSIFMPFTQADNSRTRTHTGTGLGITIANQIVEQMSGQIWVDSTVGEGTCFSFEVYLPKGSKQKHQTKSEEQLAPLKMLLVEDVEENVLLTTLRLGKLGHSIDVANNGQEAVTIYCDDPTRYSCILMDIHLPIMDGLEASKRIREFESSKGMVKNIPIIALTASASPEDQQACTEAGINAFCTKPIDFHYLTETIAVTVPKAIRLAPNQESANSSYNHIIRDTGGVEVIDFAEAIEAWDDENSVLQALESTINRYGNAAEVIADYIDQGNMECAYSEADALKGIAENLRAKRVYQITSRLCKAMHSRTENYDEYLNNLALSLSELNEALTELKKRKDANKFSEEKADNVIPLLGALDEALGESDDNQEISKRLSSLKNQIDSELFTKLEECVEKGAFSEARSLVEAMKKKYELFA